MGVQSKWNELIPYKNKKIASPGKIPNQKELKLRVFAGPNGSGKSTVIEQVRKYKSGGKLIDFGYYINADDIASALRKNGFSFRDFDLVVGRRNFRDVVTASGLINTDFDEKEFEKSFSLRAGVIRLPDKVYAERLAQIIADYLRKRLLAEKKRFSFETVFSHRSKLEIMRQAAEAGYKVYLYFVSTESPLINIYRVAFRKSQGGHDVPPEKIKSRYYRSLELLYDAAELSYQAFFFDNSFENVPFKMVAHFKKSTTGKKWDKINNRDLPRWFFKYYRNKKSL